MPTWPRYPGQTSTACGRSRRPAPSLRRCGRPSGRPRRSHRSRSAARPRPAAGPARPGPAARGPGGCLLVRPAGLAQYPFPPPDDTVPDGLPVTGWPDPLKTYHVPPKLVSPSAPGHARAGVTGEGVKRPVVIGDLKVAAGVFDRPDRFRGQHVQGLPLPVEAADEAPAGALLPGELVAVLEDDDPHAATVAGARP